MSHTTVIREALVDGSVAPGDVRLHHNSDFSGESELQVTGRCDWEYRVPLDEPAARLIAAAPEMLTLLREAWDMSDHGDEFRGQFHTSSNEQRCLHCRIEALLKTIDGQP